MNVSKIIHAAARQLGIVASGEELAGDELQDAIEALQSLLAQWATKRYYVHKAIDLEIPLTHGKTVYLVGNLKGDCCEYVLNCCGYVIPRPDITVEISHIADLAFIDDCPVSIARDTNITLHCPDVVYSVDAPNWTFTVKPDGQLLKIKAYTLPYKLCAADCLHLPPVYERALKFALVKELASEYGKSMSAEAQQNYTEAMQFLQDSNSTPFYEDTALPIGVGCRNSWNFYHG